MTLCVQGALELPVVKGVAGGCRRGGCGRRAKVKHRGGSGRAQLDASGRHTLPPQPWPSPRGLVRQVNSGEKENHYRNGEQQARHCPLWKTKWCEMFEQAVLGSGRRRGVQAVACSRA